MYIYQADVWCDSCADKICAELRADNKPDTGDSEDFHTMRFFRSRVSQAVCPLPNGAALFMTSEQFVASNGWKAPRKWSLRLAKPDGDIDQVGDFQAFNSRGAALRMMRKLAEWCRSTDRKKISIPEQWARLSVGLTPTGIQIWCVRHGINVDHIRFTLDPVEGVPLKNDCEH